MDKEPICKAEMETQMLRTNVWTPRGKAAGGWWWWWWWWWWDGLGDWD